MSGIDFKTSWIKQSHLTDWFNNHKVERSTYFRQDGLQGKDCEGKVVIGRLLAVNSPDNDKAVYHGYQLNMRQGGGNTAQNKRPKLGPGKFASYKYMLVFADQMYPPNCFTIILKMKMQFQRLFSFASLAHDVTIGDVIGIIHPRPTGAVLGENMTILEDPYLCVSLKQDAIPWKEEELRMSDEANQQRAFYKTGMKAESSLIQLNWGDKVPCKNVTCDRQNPQCSGCFGASQTMGPIVLQADIDILNCPHYNLNNNGKIASFAKFTSFKFTSLFFQSISILSGITPDNRRAYDSTCKSQVPKMIDVVNKNGGWTVAGWHRRGVQYAAGFGGDADEATLSTSTMGHLTLLMPTNPKCIELEDFTKELIPSELPVLAEV